MRRSVPPPTDGRRRRVAAVGTGLLRQTGATGSPGYGLAHGLSAQRLMGKLSWEKPFLRSNLPPISAQQFQQLGGEWDVAVPITLALLDANHHALAVDVANPQMHDLADAHPGAVHGAEDDAVRKGRSRFQKPQHFCRAEDHRQMVFFAGHGEHFDEAIPLQSDPVEKPQCSHRHQAAVHGHLSVLGQVELVFPNLFGA